MLSVLLFLQFQPRKALPMARVPFLLRWQGKSLPPYVSGLFTSVLGPVRDSESQNQIINDSRSHQATLFNLQIRNLSLRDIKCWEHLAPEPELCLLPRKPMLCPLPSHCPQITLTLRSLPSHTRKVAFLNLLQCHIHPQCVDSIFRAWICK